MMSATKETRRIYAVPYTRERRPSYLETRYKIVGPNGKTLYKGKRKKRTQQKLADYPDGSRVETYKVPRDFCNYCQPSKMEAWENRPDPHLLWRKAHTRTHWRWYTDGVLMSDHLESNGITLGGPADE